LIFLIRGFDVYADLRDPIIRYLTQPAADKEAEVRKFTRAAVRAQFLFGPEVTKLLEDTRLDLTIDIHESRHRPGPEALENQRKAIEDKMVARIDRLAKIIGNFDVLVAPYMKHTQKQLPDFITLTHDWMRSVLKRT
jgi:hypothetical protein